MNQYIFIATYSGVDMQRTINAKTYNAALNLLYFPPGGDTQADAATLIALEHGEKWVGDYGMSNPSTFDIWE